MRRIGLVLLVLLLKGAPAAAQNTVSVVTWNVAVGNQTETAAQQQMDFLASLSPQPQVVVLNEALFWLYNTYRDRLQAQLGGTWNGVFQPHCRPDKWNGTSCTELGQEGVAILTSLPVGAMSATLFPWADCWHSARAGAHAPITVNGTTIHVFATHLQTGPCGDAEQSRLNSIASLKTWAGGYSGPKLVAGDFNALPASIEIASSSQGMAGMFVDAWTVAGSGDGYTFEAPNPYKRIDYWFSDVGGPLSVSSISVPASSLSDHLPVRAVFSLGSGDPGGAQNVVWTNPTHVTVTGNSLQRTSGCDGCWDAGATSQQAINSGDGYVEFTVSGETGTRFLGFSDGNPGTAWNQFTFAFAISPTNVAVRESGVYKTETTATVGDLCRIAIVGGVVMYSKNGTVFYTSQIAPTYPLKAYASLMSIGATITNVVISAGSVAGFGAVVWTNLMDVAVTGNSLQKNSGCDGCSAGATSQQVIDSGDGYVEYTVSGDAGTRFLGLSDGNPGIAWNQLKFAFGISPTNVAVRESGVYKTETTATVGDVCRIAIVGGVVTYSKNGTVFYTSQVASTYPLKAHASLQSFGTSITNVMISGAN